MSKKRKSNDLEIKKQLTVNKPTVEDGKFIFNGPMTITELSTRLNRPTTSIISFFFKKGLAYNLNYTLSVEEIGEICLEFGLDFEHQKAIEVEDYMEQIKFIDNEKDLISRPPIITIMGHVDHGKTTLLDYIQKSNVATRELGGITQSIGAYEVEHNKQKITFIDTPGHEAFTSMRIRGAQLTDIVILVVAADDGVKAQTKEAIAHALNGNAPIIVFVNKMDKPSKDLERLRNDLSREKIISEEWGGDVQFVYGSALKGEGVDNLLDAIILQAEILELKANPNRMASGTVLEAHIDKYLGPIATLIVSNGTLHMRDFVVSGSSFGKIRTMKDSFKKQIAQALPGMPIIVSGFSDVLKAGDSFFAMQDEKYAKSLANDKKTSDRNKKISKNSVLKSSDEVQVLNLIIKSNNQGTLDAIKASIEKIEASEVALQIIQASVSSISKADILLATASSAVILGFNVIPNSDIKSLSKQENVVIKSFGIIYKLVDEIELMLKQLASPKYEEKIIGHSKVLKVIYSSKIGNIAGSVVEDGEIKSNSSVRVFRNGLIIKDTKLKSLQVFKDQVKSVKKGNECGISLQKFDEVKIDDVFEFYQFVEIEE